MAVDLALAKQEVRILNAEEDAIIAHYLAAAVAWVENYTGKLLTRREVEQEAPAFTAYLPLFYGPDPVSLEIAYTDADDQPQTVADAKIVQGRAFPASSWPTIADNTPVTLTYTAGYQTTPADLDDAVLLYVKARFDELRRGADPEPAMTAIESLCRPYRKVMV
jgi:hypothetical protein